MRSDLGLIRNLLHRLFTGTMSLPQAEVVDQAMDDIENKLGEELDYLREAGQLTWFHEHLTLPGLVIPLPVMALTSRRVLTMHHLPGSHLAEWLLTTPSQAERDHYGQLLFDSFLHCAFHLRRIQADPHAGNYVFMTGGQLGLLDFGCTRELRPDFCAAISSAWSDTLASPWDTVRLRHAYQSIGMVAVQMSHEDFQTNLLPAIADLLRWQGLPFAVDVYDFGQHPPPQPSLRQQRQALRHLQTLPPDLPYFDRAWIGLVQLLKQLGAWVRTTNSWINRESAT